MINFKAESACYRVLEPCLFIVDRTDTTSDLGCVTGHALKVDDFQKVVDRNRRKKCYCVNWLCHLFPFSVRQKDETEPLPASQCGRDDGLGSPSSGLQCHGGDNNVPSVSSVLCYGSSGLPFPSPLNTQA